MTTPVTDRAAHGPVNGVPAGVPAGIPPCCLPGSSAHSLPAPLSSNARRPLATPLPEAVTSEAPGR